MRTPIATTKRYILSDGFTFSVNYEAGENVPVTQTFERNGKIEIGDIFFDGEQALAVALGERVASMGSVRAILADALDEITRLGIERIPTDPSSYSLDEAEFILLGHYDGMSLTQICDSLRRLEGAITKHVKGLVR